MKIRVLFAIVISLFAVSLARAESYGFKEPVTRSASFSAQGKVILHNVNGNITVESWDKNEIAIEGEKSAKTDEELKLIDLAIDLTEDRAEITVKLPKRGGIFGQNTIRAAVSFNIRVPATASLDRINTVNSSVTIAGIQGGSRVETVNGQIDARALTGVVKFSTVNGQIHATLSKVSEGQDLSFKTVNGNMNIRLPADAGFSVKASVVNGDIHCEFPLTDGSASKGKHLNGKVGDCRASLKAETVNGSVHITKD